MCTADRKTGWADALSRGDLGSLSGKRGTLSVSRKPARLYGGRSRFYRRDLERLGGAVYQDVMAVAERPLEKIPYVDKDRMGAMGWSFGGYMMMWLEGHTSRFKAIACMMGVYDLTAMHGSTEELWFPQWDLGGAPWESDLYMKWSPNQYVKNFKTPCLVITGEKDYRVPYPQ